VTDAKRSDGSQAANLATDGELVGADEQDAPVWLLRYRVTVPDRPVDYCDRAHLTRRCALTRQRLTLLVAPGGFGKTTLLAECCREANAGGVPTAWLTLSGDDEPDVLDMYLAFAFKRAGVDLFGDLGSTATVAGLRFPRTGLVIRALEALDEACVLVLDELESVTNDDSVALLNFLLNSAPPNLHVALACREIPFAFHAMQGRIGGTTEMLTADDLRFATGDIARFFDLRLSKRELARITSESSGWPIALRICRNQGSGPLTEDAQVVRQVIGNWIAGRFWDGFAEDDRELILDMSLFEWTDADLFEEVTESPGVFQRIARLPGLAGLFVPASRALPGVYVLHPLLREHCAGRRLKEDPARYREIHRRIGISLARRGETVAAMRHAAEARDPALAGRMLIEAGSLQWCMREGADRLMAASRFLTDDVVGADPRLGMVRCVVQVMTGRRAEARQTFASVSTPASGDLGLEADRRIVRGLLVVTGCEAIDSAETQAVMDEASRIADVPNLPSMLRATADCGLCVYRNLRGEFGDARERGLRVRRRVGRRSTYLSMMVDFQFGQMAMAGGDVRTALACYRKGQRAAKARFLRDPNLAAYGEVLTREINLERNRVEGSVDRDIRIWKDVYPSGVPYECYLAASEVSVGLALELKDAERACTELDEMWEHARGTGLTTLERHLAALQVSLLAEMGRVAEAERIWRAHGLPESDADCVDLAGRSWREMEAISCARLRQLAASGKYDAGRDFARRLEQVAVPRGLKRTWMRGLALSMALEYRSGQREAAVERVETYVRQYAGTDYARPLVLAGAPGMETLGWLLDSNPRGPLAESATRLWSVVERARCDGEGTPRLTARQVEVLGRLGRQQDKEIAADLGISTHGVRYHIRNIFHKLDVNDRHGAVVRARASGLLPAETS